MRVMALKYHTHAGEEHHEGDVYEVADADVANLEGQGMAKPIQPPAPAPKKPSQPVQPMTIDNSGLKA